MSRNSSTFIYLTLFLGLACYLTFIDKKIPGTKEEEQAATELYKFNQDDVTGLEISNVHGLLIFQKVNGHWEIKSPVNTPADGAAVDEVVGDIANAQPQRVIPIDGNDKGTPATLKEWGLAPAAERVVIHTKDKNYELLVGRKMAINDSVYARASGRKNEPVRILPSTVKLVLQKDLSDFRSRSVFDFDADQATAVETSLVETATAPAQECEVDLKDGVWTLQKPVVARASTSDVQALLAKILGLRVTDFVTDAASNLSPYGLTSPTATLSVTTKAGPQIVLQIGGPVPNKPGEVYAQRLKSNSVFTLVTSSVDDLIKALPNVRDRHVLPFDPGKATALSFSFGQKQGEARSIKGLWYTVGDAVGRADVGRITDALARLSQLETTPVLKDSAPDLKPFGLDKPQGKITVQPGGAKPGPSLTLLIGKDENKLLYVRNSMEPFIYTVPETAFDFLPDNDLALLDARAIDLQLNQVRRLTITEPPAPPIVLDRSPGGTWTAANVKDRMVDSVKTDSQASLFCQLQAKKWLGPALPFYGLSKPVLTLAVLAEQPKPTVLRVGAILPDGDRAAEIEGNPITFEISDGDFGILNSSSLQPIPSTTPEPATTNAATATVSAPATNAPASTPEKPKKHKKKKD
jgi:hypothetical protein